MAKTGLGRGLGALMGGPAAALTLPEPLAEKGERIRQIPPAQIATSPLQPRKHFDPEAFAELVASVRERGILQPLIVRPVNGRYELIAGERRWRAAQEAQLAAVPVIVREAGDDDVLQLALIENLQRADLNPIEEAQAYALLIERFQLTQEEAARRVGKNRVSVANALRLLNLAPGVRALVESGRLSAGHAKVLLALSSAAEQALAAERIFKGRLSVRQAEKLVASLQGVSSSRRGKAARRDAAWADLEKRLQRHFGTRVRIADAAGKKAGRIEIEFFSPDELDRLLKLLGLPPEA